MKNYTYTFTLFWILAIHTVFAQNEHLISEAKIYKMPIYKQDLERLYGKEFTHPKKAENLLPFFTGAIQTTIQKYQNSENPILLLEHPLKEGKEDTESLRSVLIHQQNNVFTDYLLGKKKLLIIFIGDTKNLENLNVKIEAQESLFKIQLRDLFKLTTLASTENKNNKFKKDSTALPKDDTVNVSLIEIDNQGIRAPYTVTLSYKKAEDIIVKFHERSYFTLQAGIATKHIDKNTFKIEEGKLIVKPDSAQAEEWKSNLFAIVAFHPIGVDYDRLNPIWKRRPKDMKFCQSFGQRLGIYVGLQLSKDPIQSIHTGLNFAISKELYINFGYAWHNQIVPQVKDIGDITDVDAAKKYAKREYKGVWHWSISMSPSAMLSTLQGK